MECEDALADVIAEETEGLDAGDVPLRILARYILELPDLVATDPAPRESLAAAFDRFRRGWPELA